MRRMLVSLLLLCVASLGAAAEENLPAYNSYSSVPFVVGELGMATDLVHYLNGKLKGRYHFTLTPVTREALNNKLASDPNFKGVVLFLNPFFVGDPDKTKFAWSAPLMSDSNAVISLASRKLEYSGPDALKGLKFGGVKGNRYAGLDERFGKDIVREDVTEELSNIRKIAAGKVDVTIMASSTYRYLLKQMGKDNAAKNNLYTSTKPHAQFERQLLVAKDNAGLAKELNDLVDAMKTDPLWKAILVKYGLD